MKTKFRAWVDDIMIYPEDSNFLLMFNGVVLDTRCKESNPVARFCGNYDIWSWGISHNEPRVIMQHIGLTAKCGTSIYHKDIVKFMANGWLEPQEAPLTERIGIVEWNEETLCWEILVDGKPISNLRKSYNDNHFEIIGNAYETPNLLSTNQAIKKD